jgi:hypothetical protein
VDEINGDFFVCYMRVFLEEIAGGAQVGNTHLMVGGGSFSSEL